MMTLVQFSVNKKLSIVNSEEKSWNYFSEMRTNLIDHLIDETTVLTMHSKGVTTVQLHFIQGFGL